MKKFSNAWKKALALILVDDYSSFYSFFSIIFIEIAFLWVFMPTSAAFNLTLILLGYLACVIIFAHLRDKFSDSLLVSVLYVAVFIGLITYACIINFTVGIACSLTPIILTAIIMNIHSSSIVGNSTILDAVYLYLFIGVPFVVFTTFFGMIPHLPILVKILVPIIYFAFIPFSAFIEDRFGALDIFEIATAPF